MDFLAQNQLYIVMIIVLAIWVGIYIYLFRLDSRVRKLEGQIRNNRSPEGRSA